MSKEIKEFTIRVKDTEERSTIEILDKDAFVVSTITVQQPDHDSLDMYVQSGGTLKQLSGIFNDIKLTYHLIDRNTSTGI